MLGKRGGVFPLMWSAFGNRLPGIVVAVIVVFPFILLARRRRL